MLARPLLIGSEIYRRSTYGSRHPLAIPRVSTALDLIWALGAVTPERYVDSPRATIEQLARFHDRDYLAALELAERDRAQLSEEDRRRYQIGINGNPIFAEILSRPSTAAGGTLKGLALLHEADGGIVHNVGGGTHHGRKDKASGFCYLNDPVIGILDLLDRGYERILYVDLDAHHGDGVQDALSHDPRVLIVSVHEQARWPFSGMLGDRGGGQARNIPVPSGFNDDEMDFILDAALLPLADRFDPEILILQLGADALAEDPLSKQELSNGALWRAVSALKRTAPKVLAMGGGGYNPWSVARAWAGNWLVLNDLPIPDRLPFAAETVLRALHWDHSKGREPPEHWFTTLADGPRPGPIREAVRLAVADVLR